LLFPETYAPRIGYYKAVAPTEHIFESMCQAIGLAPKGHWVIFVRWCYKAVAPTEHIFESSGHIFIKIVLLQRGNFQRRIFMANSDFKEHG